MNAQENMTKLNIALLDTTGREAEVYRPFIELAESGGFKIVYKPIDEIMDTPVQALALEKFDGVFFIFGNEFFAGLRYSSLTHKILELVKNYAKLSGKLVGFILPALRVDKGMNVVSAFAPVFNNLGVVTPRGQLAFPDLSSLETPSARVPRDARDITNGSPSQKTLQKTLDAFFYTANTFLTSPLEMRPLAYHTTLNMPHAGVSFYNEEIERLLQASNIFLSVLPVKQDCSPEVKATLPYGLYWFNPMRNNHVFITTTTLASFSGISESFHVCPTSFDLRRDMHTMMQQMLWELKILVKNKDLLQSGSEFRKNILLDQCPPLPQSIVSIGDIGDMSTPVDQENSSGVKKIAWLELVIFDDLEYDLAKTTEAEIVQDKIKRTHKQDLLVDYILKSGLDTLWISLTPNIFYSPIARCGSKVAGKKSAKELQFLAGLSRFTEKLKNRSQELTIEIPKIMVGFELATNLYAPNLPQLYAIDLYGNTYPDLPAPLDRSFWNNEIKLSLDLFLQEWARDEISHGLKIAGVVFDFEMYCRKRTGTFSTTMGFDGYSFKNFLDQKFLDQKFVQRVTLHPGQLSIHDRVSYLMKNKLSKSYYRFLEQEAESIGKDMGQFFAKQIPECIVMCYMPSVLINWVYRGLCKGLNAYASPLHLLTFNAEFKMHENWFKQNKITANHASVLLLSKVGTPDDFMWVDTTLDHHHGIWLNRFSRFVEDKTRDWTSVEQPQIPEYLYGSFLEHIAAIK